MSYIRVSKELTIRMQPIFIGWLDRWNLKTDNPVSAEQVPLKSNQVDDILFSLDKKIQNIPGLNTMNVKTQPIEEYQNISIGGSCIKDVFQLDNKFFSAIHILPFDANFLYVPENVPPLFEEPGIYIARFDIIIGTKTDAYAVEFTVM
ncbi:MAG: hypothetical protein FWD31_08140 [Planctomycetaceae bacterium]|nr:hypothetical protein [Planctomycetaceae bacterium]